MSEVADPYAVPTFAFHPAQVTRKVMPSYGHASSGRVKTSISSITSRSRTAVLRVRNVH
jgi:hypothetical protein